MMFHTNVNADMTKYLPDDSQMKRGLEIITDEFGSSAQMSGTDVHVMFEGIRPNEVPGMRTLLNGYPDVKGIWSLTWTCPSRWTRKRWASR